MGSHSIQWRMILISASWLYKDGDFEDLSDVSRVRGRKCFSSIFAQNSIGLCSEDSISHPLDSLATILENASFPLLS